MVACCNYNQSEVAESCQLDASTYKYSHTPTIKDQNFVTSLKF